jgi:hypothetical protein
MIARTVGSVRMGTCKTGALLVLVCAAAVGCSAGKGNLTARDADHDGREVNDEGFDVPRLDVLRLDVPGPDATNPDEGGRCDPAAALVAATDASVSSRSDAEPQLPADLVAPAPPDVCCDANVGAAACDLPPSVCAVVKGADGGFVASTQWIVFYENPRCVSGHCLWDQSYFQCSGGSTACQNGACTFLGTLP